MRLGAFVGVGFIDLIVVFALCGYLRQMGDSDDLTMCRHLTHDRCHLGSDVAAHTGVYLIEDDRRQSFRGGNKRFEAEHQTAYLTAGRHFAYGTQTLVEVRRKEHLHLVATVRREVLRWAYRHLYFRVRYAESSW